MHEKNILAPSSPFCYCVDKKKTSKRNFSFIPLYFGVAKYLKPSSYLREVFTTNMVAAIINIYSESDPSIPNRWPEILTSLQRSIQER